MSDGVTNIRYMAEFTLPDHLTEEMTNTIPAQREMIGRYFHSGKLLSYTLAADKRKLWSVFMCQSEAELVNLIEKLPMTMYFEYNYTVILFHETITHFPIFSLN